MLRLTVTLQTCVDIDNGPCMQLSDYDDHDDKHDVTFSRYYYGVLQWAVGYSSGVCYSCGRKVATVPSFFGAGPG